MIAGSSNTQVSIGYQTGGFGSYTLASTPKYLRVTSADFKENRGKTKSKELRSDLQPGGVATVSVDAAATMNYELSFGEYDNLLAAAIRASGWVGGSTTPTQESVTTTATTITSTTTVFTPMVKGQWLSLYVVTTSTMYYAKVVTVTGANAVTVSAATPLPVLSAQQAVLYTSTISNGTTERYFSIEEIHADIAQYDLYRDMKLSKLSIDVVSKQEVTGSMEFMGSNGTMSSSVTITSPQASETNQALTASVNVGQILINGVASTAKIKSFKLGLDIGARIQDAIGTAGAIGIGSGTFNPTVSIEVYFEDATFWALYNNDTFFSMDVILRDTTSGYGYAIRMPKCQLDKLDKPSSGRDADIMLSSGVTVCSNDGAATAGERITLAIDRLGGKPVNTLWY